MVQVQLQGRHAANHVSKGARCEYPSTQAHKETLFRCGPPAGYGRWPISVLPTHYAVASPILELCTYGWDALELIVKLMLTCVSKGEALP